MAYPVRRWIGQSPRVSMLLCCWDRLDLGNKHVRPPRLWLDHSHKVFASKYEAEVRLFGTSLPGRGRLQYHGLLQPDACVVTASVI